MNKKLLLILSILMSLSLLTMSCAKSVAAPDIVEGTVGLEDLNSTDAENYINNALRTIPIISGSNYSFDFSTAYLYFQYDGLGYRVIIYDYTYNSQPTTIDKNEVLNKLISALNNVVSTDSKVNLKFTPESNWDAGYSDTKYSYLNVKISSSTHNIPIELQTIIIGLYLGNNTWQ